MLTGYLCISQKSTVIGDCTVTYSLTTSDPSVQSKLAGASKTVYIKGQKSRTDFLSDGFRQTTIYDKKAGMAVVMKEIGAEKYISKYTQDEWKSQNKKYELKTVSLINETKTILSYTCKKAVITTRDGNSYSFYYAPSIVPSATENPFQFSDIPGLVLEYESSAGSSDKLIVFTATSINLSPVPASKFEIPTTGFRLLKE